jgi:hypothetical protein
VVVRLLESLYILDCYRVIIMQIPPSLSWHHVDSVVQSLPPDSQMAQLQHVVAGLTGPAHSRTDSSFLDRFSMASLASLSPYLWPAIYPRQNRHHNNDDNGLISEGLSSWKADFIELACDNWLRTSSRQSRNPATLAIYHMMNIMLHANPTALQSFAHSSPGSAARDPKKTSAASEVHAWVQDRHYGIAHWHAEHLIHAIETAFVAAPLNRQAEYQQDSQRRPASVSPVSSASVEQARLPFEAPHVPFAIYYATLVLWCGAAVPTKESSATTASISSQSAAAVSAVASAARAHVVRGERILSLHKVHIAQLLARVLNQIR